MFIINMNPYEKRYAHAAQKMMIFEAGLAVAEMPQVRLRTLEAEVYRDYATRLGLFGPRSDNMLEIFSDKSYAFSLRNVHVETFKILISGETLTGKKIWAAYNYMKSEIVNHWLPHFKVGSGEEIDDAVERVWIHVWEYQADRTIKLNNKNRIKAGSDDLEDLKVWQVASEGSTSNFMLELPILKKYSEHPYLQVRES